MKKAELKTIGGLPAIFLIQIRSIPHHPRFVILEDEILGSEGNGVIKQLETTNGISRATNEAEIAMQADIPQHVAKGIAEQHHARQALGAKFRQGTKFPIERPAVAVVRAIQNVGVGQEPVSIRLGAADSVSAGEVGYFLFR